MQAVMTQQREDQGVSDDQVVACVRQGDARRDVLFTAVMARIQRGGPDDENGAAA
jgi:hypothetical protein